MEWMWDDELLPVEEEDVDVELVAAGLTELIAGHDDETALLLILNVVELALEWQRWVIRSFEN